MPSLETLLSESDARAAGLGHAIVWETVNEQTASGRCSGCGREVGITVQPEGLYRQTGTGFQETCTRDLIMHKPSLRRDPESTEAQGDAAATTETPT
jgi:hypothetical protein